MQETSDELMKELVNLVVTLIEVEKWDSPDEAAPYVEHIISLIKREVGND